MAHVPPWCPKPGAGVVETGARFNEMNPPTNVDEFVQTLGVDATTPEGLQQAVGEARRQQALAESLTDTGLVEARVSQNLPNATGDQPLSEARWHP